MDGEERLRTLYRRWLGALPPAGDGEELWARILEDLEQPQSEEAGK